MVVITNKQEGGLVLTGKTSETKPGPYVDIYHVESFTIDPLSAVTLTLKLSKETTLEGYLTVKGGTDDIRFYIKDPSGTRRLDIKRVLERYDFCYLAKTDGPHSLSFNNGFSFTTGKHIYLYYRMKQNKG